MSNFQMFNKRTPRLVNVRGQPFLGGARRQVMMFVRSRRGAGRNVPTFRTARWLMHNMTEKWSYARCLDFVKVNDIYNPFT